MTARRLWIAALIVLTVAGGVQAAIAAPERQVVAAPERQVAVVVDAGAGRDPAVLADARAAVERTGGEAQLRVPRTPTEQLSVTHYFAVKGYDLVVGVGLDRGVAVTPVADRYGDTRFVSAAPGEVSAALAR